MSCSDNLVYYITFSEVNRSQMSRHLHHIEAVSDNFSVGQLVQ